MRLILSTYQYFFFNILRFQLPQNITSTDEITRVIRHKRGKIGPPYLLSENGFFDTVPGRQHSGKVSKNCSATFVSEESV